MRNTSSKRTVTAASYLRGRHELQVLDDFGKAPESHGHMAVYAMDAAEGEREQAAGGVAGRGGDALRESRERDVER